MQGIYATLLLIIDQRHNLTPRTARASHDVHPLRRLSVESQATVPASEVHAAELPKVGFMPDEEEAYGDVKVPPGLV